MKLEKALKRDKQYFKKKNGMRISGKSIFVIVETLAKKGKKGKKKK
jgi:hypothetical protein